MSTLTIQPAIAPRTSRAERALLRVLPSFTDFAFLFPLVALFLLMSGGRGLLNDGDTGWHIRTGDWILQHRHVPQVDLFSFTKQGQSWFAWEWLWDIAFSFIHRFWGLSGVVFVNALILSGVSVLLYRLVRRHASNDARALVITLAAICATAVHWLGRPHLLSWLLVLIALHLIERAQQGGTRILWWFPLLLALWANLHGSFPIAIFFLLAYGSMNTLQGLAYSGFRDFRNTIRRERIWFIVAAASLAASLLNPYGWHLHEHIAVYLGDTKQLNNISEFLPFDFHSPLAVCVEGFLLLGGCAAINCFRTKRWAQGLILLVWAHMAFKSARNMPIFVFLAAPAVAELVTSILENFERAEVAIWFRAVCSRVLRFGKGFDAFERVERVPFIPAIAVLIVAIFLGILPGGARIADFDAKTFPVAAAGVLAKRPGARVFTFDQWGDYMIYRFYPQMRVFSDGRSDFYGADYSQGWIKAVKAAPDWRKELARYSIDTVLLETDAPLSSVLKEVHDWKTVYDDGHAVVFVRR